jgi:copper oxidase (laccase) domain-containing protein
MEHFENETPDAVETQSERYKKIDKLNKQSFFMTEGSELKVLQSLHSIGASREALSPKHAQKYDPEFVEKSKYIGRHVIDGNMSPLNNYGPSELTPEERIQDAKRNVAEFFYSADIDPADVRLLRPERDYDTPMTVVHLDETNVSTDDSGLLRPDTAGDMMYTYDSNITLAARPADCPLAFVTAQTPRGELTAMVHFASLGVAHGYVEQTKHHLDALAVDWDTVRVQLSAGGHAETYTYENFTQYDTRVQFPEYKNLYVNVEETINEQGETAYSYGVDVAAETYERIIQHWDVEPFQVFADTTDTTSAASGYSSNSRAFKGYEVDGDNTRDIVVAHREKMPLQNPENPTPAEILETIKTIRVKYIDIEGEERIGSVEIHKDLAADIKTFFKKAVELNFPIQHVVKSSDERYQWDDDKLMADNATTGFNYRLIKGTDRPSLHGLGRAFDVNDMFNPYVRYVDGKAITDPEGAVYDPATPGTLTAEHPLVVFMKQQGWVWGGDWTEAENGVTDYQHFQKAP